MFHAHFMESSDLSPRTSMLIRIVATWADSMETGTKTSEGIYYPSTTSFTYNAEYEMMPGMKSKIREVVRIVDADHHVFEWYENDGGQERKTMEITYTRKK